MSTKTSTTHNNNNNNNKNNNINPTLSPPPWEVLILISHHLDPKSLAISSCVSTTWSTIFSSDHLWSPLFSSHFPSLSSLSSASASATVPRRRLFALGHAARLRRHRPRPKPNLSLHHLLFTLSLKIGSKAIHVITPCTGVQRDPHGLFRFDIEVDKEDREWVVEELSEMRLTWNVVKQDWEGEWKAVFTMAEECGGRGSFSSGVEGWFSTELPSPGCCCSSTASSGLVADLRLGLVPVSIGGGDHEHRDHFEYCWGVWGCRKNKVRVEKVSVGILSVLNWRYVSLEDGLFYLEHFLDHASNQMMKTTSTLVKQ